MAQNAVSTQLHSMYPELESDYQQTNSRLIGLASTQGASDGEQNTPLHADDYKVRIVDVVQTTIQESLSKLAITIPTISGIILAKSIANSAAEKIRRIRTDLLEDELQLKEVIRELTVNRPNAAFNIVIYVIHCCLVFIGAAEGAINLPSFLAMGLPYYNAVITAIAAALIVIVGSVYFAGVIRRAPSPGTRNKRLCAVLAAYLLLFSILGQFRLHAISNVPAEITDLSEITLSNQSVDPCTVWGIVGTSFLMFCLGLLACIRYTRSKEELGRLRVYKENMARATELEQKVNAAKSEIKAIESASELEQKRAIKDYEAALAYQARYIALGERTLKIYNKANLLHRSDGICPDFFTTLPPLTYNCVFQHSSNA